MRWLAFNLDWINEVMLNFEDMVTHLAVEVTRTDFLEGSFFKDRIVCWFIILRSGSDSYISKLKASGEYQHLGMTRVSLVLNALGSESDYSIEHPDFALAVWRLAESPFHFELKHF